MVTDYSTWTLDALNTRFIASGDELSTVAEERRALLAEISARMSKATATALIASLSDADKSALMAALTADGVAAPAASLTATVTATSMAAAQ